MGFTNAGHESFPWRCEAFVPLSERFGELLLLRVNTDRESCPAKDRSCHEAQHVAGSQHDPDEDER